MLWLTVKKNRLFVQKCVLIFCVLANCLSIVAVDTKKRRCIKRFRYIKKERYNPGATEQLQAIFDKVSTPEEYQTHSSEMQRLIVSGADPNIVSSCSRSFLRRAIRENSLSLTRLSLECDADPNTVDPIFGHTPLMEAESIEIAQCLLKYKADPFCTISDSGETILHIFAKHGRPVSLLNFFCQQGIDPNQGDTFNDTPLNNLLSPENGGGISALKKAAVLLFFGADPHKRNNNRYTALYRDYYEPFSRDSRDLLAKAKLLVEVMPAVKKEQEAQNARELHSCVSKYLPLPTPLAALTVAYVGSSPLAWSTKTWLTTQRHMINRTN